MEQLAPVAGLLRQRLTGRRGQEMDKRIRRRERRCVDLRLRGEIHTRREYLAGHGTLGEIQLVRDSHFIEEGSGVELGQRRHGRLAAEPTHPPIRQDGGAAVDAIRVPDLGQVQEGPIADGIQQAEPEERRGAAESRPRRPAGVGSS